MLPNREGAESSGQWKKLLIWQMQEILPNNMGSNCSSYWHVFHSPSTGISSSQYIDDPLLLTLERVIMS